MKKIILINTILFFCLTVFSQNMGIDQSNPSEKLDVNGTVKGNSIKFPDGSTQTKAPRVIHTTDPRGGCPPAHAANTDLFVQSFSTTASTLIYVSAAIIRNTSGRADLQLYVDGVQRDITLTYTSSTQWEDGYVEWTGSLGAGNHTVSLRSPQASVWGCQTDWGSIDTIIFE